MLYQAVRFCRSKPIARKPSLLSNIRRCSSSIASSISSLNAASWVEATFDLDEIEYGAYDPILIKPSLPNISHQSPPCLLQLFSVMRLEKAPFSSKPSYFHCSRPRPTSQSHSSFGNTYFSFLSEDIVDLSKKATRTRDIAIRFRRAVI